jgi:hypothetical protein
MRAVASKTHQANVHRKPVWSARMPWVFHDLVVQQLVRPCLLGIESGSKFRAFVTGRPAIVG